MIPPTHTTRAALARPQRVPHVHVDPALPLAGPPGLTLNCRQPVRPPGNWICQSISRNDEVRSDVVTSPRESLLSEQGVAFQEMSCLTPYSAELEEVIRSLRHAPPDVRRRAAAAAVDVAAEYACQESDGESTQGPSSQDHSVERETTDASDHQLDFETAATYDLGLCRGRKQRCPRGYRAETGCDGLCLLCNDDRPSWWSYEDEHMFQERSACGDMSKLPCPGSALHPERCHPCGFFRGKTGCSHGDKCFHCHTCLPAEFKARRKEKTMKLREAEKVTNSGRHCHQPIIQPAFPSIVFWIPYGYVEPRTQVTAMQ